MRQLKQILFIVLLLFSVKLAAQETIEAKSTLAIGLDFGVNGNMLRGKVGQSPFYRPSPGLTIDYKFGKSILGVLASVNFQQYKYNGIKLDYVSIPTIIYFRVGKKFQYQFGFGLSANMRVGSKIENWVQPYNYDEKKNTTKYGTGGVLNTSMIYNFKKNKHQLALNFYFNTTTYQLKYGEPSTSPYDDSKRLMGYRLSIEYKYILFRRK